MIVQHACHRLRLLVIFAYVTHLLEQSPALVSIRVMSGYLRLERFIATDPSHCTFHYQYAISCVTCSPLASVLFRPIREEPRKSMDRRDDLTFSWIAEVGQTKSSSDPTKGGK